jgi:hypothetical protein
MEAPIPEPQADTTGGFDLGAALGQVNAFGAVAARCSAAQAALLARVRQEKLYKNRTEHWEKFCPEYLKMSRSEADKRIALWNEFGATYFDVSQFASISAETYRLMAPSIKSGAIHLEDEIIQLNPENAQKVAAAVSEFKRRRRAAAASTNRRPTPAIYDEVQELRLRCSAVMADFRAILHKSKGGPAERIVPHSLFSTARDLGNDLAAFQAECNVNPVP